jgi:hypothetical protein
MSEIHKHHDKEHSLEMRGIRTSILVLYDLPQESVEMGVAKQVAKSMRMQRLVS